MYFVEVEMVLFFSWYEDGLVNKDGVVRKKAGKYFFLHLLALFAKLIG